jgi:hypothetical protein
VVEEPVSIPKVVKPDAKPVADVFVGDEEPVILPVTEANVFEDTVKRTVLEDEIIPVVEEPVSVPKVTTPDAKPVADVFVGDEEPVVIPVTEANVFEDTVERTVLEDEIIPAYVEPVVISDVITPEAKPVYHTVVVEEEEVIMPETKANVFQDERTNLIKDEVTKRRITVVDESEGIIEAPVTRSVFEAAEDTKQINDGIITEESLRNYDYIELDSVNETAEQTKDQPVLVKKVSTTVIEDDKVVLKITEEHREALPVVEEVVIADEPVVKEEEPKPNTKTNISTIPMDMRGNIIKEEPMIPVIPTDAVKGVGSNAASLPFVLPATEQGRKTMADYKDLLPKEEKDDSVNAVNKDQDIPYAPEISLLDKDEPEATPTPATDNTPKVIVADGDLNLNFGDFDKPDEEPVAEPEVIPEPVEEPIEEPVEEPVIEEPIEEPEEEPVVEPEVIPEPVEEPVIEEPVFTDAEHADELMTDEEAEEHIEIIEEAPDRERKGKMNPINLDTICDNFENGEVVTLEALQEKKLLPKKTGRVKILARGTMTKQLDIIADSFSLQAVKMITLAGGRAEQFK